jgi:hypothetical protein
VNAGGALFQVGRTASSYQDEDDGSRYRLCPRKQSDLDAGPWYPAFGTISAGPGDRVTLVPVPANAIPTGFTAANPDDSGTIWVPSFWTPLTSNSGDLGANFNLRQEVPASELSRSGSQVRCTFEASTSEACTWSHVTIGQKAASGDAWDVESGTNTQVTFDAGSASKVASAGTRIVTDAITFSLDETKAHHVGEYFGGGTSSDNMRGRTATGFTNYIKFAADELNTENATGYSTFANIIRGMVGIEVPFVA